MPKTKWDGIVVRNTLSEDGTTPRPTSAYSPDLIISGTVPFEDPSILTDPANYDKPYDARLTIGQPNYLYVRGKNFTDKNLDGHWNLFYATPNILLYPYLWEKNQLATSSGNQNPPFSIEAGKIGASEDSFRWIPQDTSDHYCLIGIAVTEEHGNPLSGVNNISNLADAMANNANIAQRNVLMVRGNVPQVIQEARYDQGSEAAKIDLAVVFENIPKGSSYTVSSGTPLHGKALSHTASNTQDNDFKYAWTDLDIPAHWNTIFTITLNFGNDWSGIPEGRHPSITIRGELVMDSQHRLYHLGRDAGTDPRTNTLRVDANGGPVRILTAGSVTVTCPDKKRS